MGKGIKLICCCGEKYDIYLGIGFLFSDLYQKTFSNAINGKYGDRYKELISTTEYAAIDAEPYLFYCEHCGFWEVQQGLDIYKPKSVEKIRHKEYGLKTVEEWGHVPYVTSYDLDMDYNLLEKYEHTCPKCSSDMKRISGIDKVMKMKLKCHKCNKELQLAGFVNWD